MVELEKDRGIREVVTEQQASLLKMLGYNRKCYNFYQFVTETVSYYFDWSRDDKAYDYNSLHEEKVSAPLTIDAITWLIDGSVDKEKEAVVNEVVGSKNTVKLLLKNLVDWYNGKYF